MFIDTVIVEYKIKNNLPIFSQKIKLSYYIAENETEISFFENAATLIDIKENGVEDLIEALSAYIYLLYILYNIKPKIIDYFIIGNKLIMHFEMNYGKYITEIIIK